MNRVGSIAKNSKAIRCIAQALLLRFIEEGGVKGCIWVCGITKELLGDPIDHVSKTFASEVNVVIFVTQDSQNLFDRG
jgi:hypothetical protein